MMKMATKRIKQELDEKNKEKVFNIAIGILMCYVGYNNQMFSP